MALEQEAYRAGGLEVPSSVEAFLESCLPWVASASKVHHLEARMAAGDAEGGELVAARDLVLTKVEMVRRVEGVHRKVAGRTDREGRLRGPREASRGRELLGAA